MFSQNIQVTHLASFCCVCSDAEQGSVQWRQSGAQEKLGSELPGVLFHWHPNVFTFFFFSLLWHILWFVPFCIPLHLGGECKLTYRTFFFTDTFIPIVLTWTKSRSWGLVCRVIGRPFCEVMSLTTWLTPRSFSRKTFTIFHSLCWFLFAFKQQNAIRLLSGSLRLKF